MLANISRSFTRKLNLGNFESADFFSSRSQEIPEGTSQKEQREISQELFALAMADVAEAIEAFNATKGEGKFNLKKLCEIVDSLSEGNPMQLSDFEKLNPVELQLIQSIKRAYKRSPEHKKTLKGGKKNG